MGTNVKSMIGAPDGCEVWEFDYSQVEFRLAVVYVECKKFADALHNGADIHAMTAQKVGAYEAFPTDPDKARYVGKQANFLIINRGGPKVLQKQLWDNARIDLPIPLSKSFLREWHSEYPEFETFASKVERAAQQRGHIKLWNGRKRHLPDPQDCRKAFNSLIQGGASQIMQESMLELDAYGFELIAQVHDSVWIILKKEHVEEHVSKIKEIMQWPTVDFKLPFPVDAKKLAG